MRKNAVFEIKDLKSILSGGKFAVSTVIGSYYNVSPSLGRQFLYYSIIGLFLAVLAVTFVVALRYRRWKLVIPIFLTNVIELFILFALLGALGTLDLSAMAGVVALIGTGVDNQIIITDELLGRKKKEEDGEEASEKEKLKRAFYIVFTTAGVAIASMLPLLLSGIVEVMGFALSTILGVLIGVAITRPAYGALVESVFDFHD
jgi:preprotein translocase subunit SecD